MGTTYLRTGLGLALAVATGCKGEDPGFYWGLEQSLEDDQCNSSPVSPEETALDYRLVFDVNDVTLAIGEDEFASGIAQGCTISYSTIVWPEERDGYAIAWQMAGSAVISRGGTDGCAPENGTDWDGTEVFTVVTSEDPGLNPGCTYTVHLQGDYLKEVQ